MCDETVTSYRSLRHQLRHQLRHIVYCVIIILFFKMAAVNGQLSSGSSISCANEGQVIHVPLISDNPCITCLCENKKVRCVKRTCPTHEGCHMVLREIPSGSCCQQCKGCVYKGRNYVSGQSWTEKKNPCLTRTCQVGVVTRSRMQCYTPCRHPQLVRGQCCPACRGCTFEGKNHREGAHFPSTKHPCVDCRCKEGSVTCSKKVCPVLNCPNSKVVHPKGACCPICTGNRTVYDFGTGSCLFRYRINRPRKSFSPNKCTKCTCDRGTTICEAENCPVITCPPSDVIHEKGACCPRCVEKPKKDCSSWTHTYKHGDIWKPDACTGCSCNDGVLRCTVKDCKIPKCPSGHKLHYEKGVCCPKCVEVESTCSVFGDPLYTTFDGKVFNFQGTCKYLLAADCVGKTFSVRVRNRARRSSLYSWTQVVIIDVDNVRINLLRYIGVKVNNKFVATPFSDNRLVTVKREGHTIVVKLNIGVEIRWDGDSYLEVKVTTKYKDRMCGLCGNYNGVEGDDLTGRYGKAHRNETNFGNSWRIGSEEACRKRAERQKDVTSSCDDNPFSRYKAERRCGVFRDPVFVPCLKIVKPGSFVRTCIADSCDCPSHKPCHCDAVRAFTRACARAGVPVDLSGSSLDKCKAPSCPRGARYSTCGPGCVTTCDDHVTGRKVTCNKPCVEGCHCPSHRVWFNNRCVKPTRCTNLIARRKRKEERIARRKDVGDGKASTNAGKDTLKPRSDTHKDNIRTNTKIVSSESVNDRKPISDSASRRKDITHPKIVAENKDVVSRDKTMKKRKRKGKNVRKNPSLNEQETVSLVDEIDTPNDKLTEKTNSEIVRISTKVKTVTYERSSRKRKRKRHGNKRKKNRRSKTRNSINELVDRKHREQRILNRLKSTRLQTEETKIIEKRKRRSRNRKSKKHSKKQSS